MVGQHAGMPKKLIRKYSPNAEALKAHPSLRWLGNSLDDANIWHLNRQSIARAAMVGLFCAFIPLPTQMIIAACAALWFKANLPFSVALVWITNPLTFAPMFYMAYKVGAWLLGITPDGSEEITVDWIMSLLSQGWQPLILGSFVCGIIAAISGYTAVIWIWHWQVVSRWEERKKKREKRKASSD